MTPTGSPSGSASRSSRGKTPLFGELLRKGVHLASIVIPLAALLVEKNLMISLLVALALVLVLADFLKLRNQGFKTFFVNVFGELLRRREKAGSITGSTILVASAALTIMLFRREIAIAALVFLSVGDSSAALVGMKWGRIRLVCGRTLEGSLAAFTSCLLASLALMKVAPFFSWRLVPIALVAGSAVATLAELVDLPVDDNLRIPILSGLAMELLIPG
ncbi:hypothetical protein GX411_11510 [Candidatus Fermentibacteria bacterium]|nr:hypothetical protein [Candidatus Fermentibacteria bacterium]